MNEHLSHSKRSDQKMFFLIVAAAVLITLVLVLWPKDTASRTIAPRAAFAECLATKGVTMYGTDTCPNCQLQKGMFEDDFKRIHYINCDIHQEECTRNGIQGYPTWMYNGQSVEGIQTFRNLSALGGCSAP